MVAPTKKRDRKPSKIVKPKQNTRRTTASTKNHRFQSFTERISKLKIDPIRRRRNAEEPDKLDEKADTYFGRSLETWRDLNLSRTFTAFVKDVAPLSDNLAVVLHNEEKIVDLLAEYIERGDGLAMEPLLSLLSHFARDLDIRFEKHFERAVATVTSVAASNEDPAVVEWCFNSLAWLFKYLSRVLTPDLRPLFDLMSPYLGKSKQKPFIVRFAAESLSFLIRKAAAVYERDTAPLDYVMGHILQEYTASLESSTATLYRDGIMTLLSDAAAGVGTGLHSSGAAIIQSCLQQCEIQPEIQMAALIEMVRGITTSLIHHCTADSFQPIIEIVLQRANVACHSDQTRTVNMYCQLTFTVVAVRKGSRIRDWRLFIDVLRSLVGFGQHTSGMRDELRPPILSVLALTFQTAPMTEVLRSSDLFKTIRQGQWSSHFLPFCDMFARLGKERFSSFLLPEFQKFVLEQWSQLEEAILTVLPHLGLPNQQITVPFAALEDQLVQLSSFGSSVRSKEKAIQLHAVNLWLLCLPYLKTDEGARESLESRLLFFLNAALQNNDDIPQEFLDFALGACLHTLLQGNVHKQSMVELWPRLCEQSANFLTMPLFWANLDRYLQVHPPDRAAMEGEHIENLQGALLECVTSPSHEVRESGLKIIECAYVTREGKTSMSLPTAILIESTPLTLESSRSISMNIRKLGQNFHHELDPLMQKVIVCYCFGLLHLKLASAWDDAVSALAEMSKLEVAQETITTLSQQWLEGEATKNALGTVESNEPIVDIDSQGFSVASDFECPNMAKLCAIENQIFQSRNHGYPTAQELFLQQHSKTPLISADARSQALRVLNKMPDIAEKKSRMLVPVLLSWASPDTINVDDGDSTQRWSRKDQKAMLQVFAQFVNPKVLFKSGEVYGALLNLCANGDVEIQRSAVKAILAWKEPALVQIGEQLTNLLDEARFRDELAVFVRGTDDDGALIDDPSRPVVMPVLLRLLYGKAVAGGKEGQRARRRSIFVALSTLGLEALDMFVDISLASAGISNMHNNLDLDQAVLQRHKSTARQSYGMLNMIDDLLDTLGQKLEPSAQRIMNAVLVTTLSAVRRLNSEKETGITDAALLRSIRQVGMQCLSKLFATMQTSDFSIQTRLVASELLLPRVDKFATENMQAVSGSLHLLSAWSATPSTAKYLIEDAGQIVHALTDLLRQPNAKDAVRLFVLRDVVDNILDDQTPVSKDQVTAMVRGVGELIDLQQSKDILDACVISLTKLASLISKAHEADQVKIVCANLLMKPGKMVSTSTKVGLLQTLSPLIDRFETSDPSQLYNALCGLFSRLRDDQSRALLAGVFVRLCSAQADLVAVAQICEGLNTLGTRLDEPDLQRREEAFVRIFEQHCYFSAEQWLPILHNCLFFIRDADDMVNRSNAARGLDRLVEVTATNSDQFDPLMNTVILPAIERGMSESSELVRAEYVRLLGHVIERLQHLGTVKDMVALTVGGDDEASFFTNILHIQQNRRLRALRRLADEAETLSSNNVTKFLIPLLEHFVFNPAEGDQGRTLADQTIKTLGSLAKALKWSSFQYAFKRYSGLLKSQPDHKKVTLRLLGVFVDALHSGNPQKGDIEVDAIKQGRPEIITRDFLPPLVAYLHLRDESTVDRRMPVAVSIVRLLQLLPEQEMSSRLPPVLTDVCHVLRSKAVEARDQTRKALEAILELVGPPFYGFLLKELRGALQKGYQLHVLSYTVHALLVSSSTNLHPGDLDHCLSDLVSVIMDDIFGVTGQEKEAEEYKTSMKEIKSSKSYDTMELLAKSTPIKQLGRLVKPIGAFLSEKLDAKSVRKVGTLLTRLEKGLDKNPEADSREILVFCHEVIRHMYATPKLNGLQSKGAGTHVLVSFGFNLLRKVLRRHDDLLQSANISGFLPMTGDALVQGQKELQLSAMRLLSTVMKLNLKELDQNAPVYVKEAVQQIKKATSMTADSAKYALELVTAVLREKREVSIKGKDIGDVLKVIKSDIDEPDREGIVYKFLRAVLGRKIMITEVYEIMDEVATVLVTNPDRNVCEGARSAYVQFVLDYPQGKDRWNKQAAFIKANLKYEHPSGRQSTMVLLKQVLSKVGDQIFTQLASESFVPLVPVHVSDEDVTCRRMAGNLIHEIFDRADEELCNTIIAWLQTWVRLEDKPAYRVAGLQCWKIVLRSKPPSTQHLKALLHEIENLLEVLEEDSSDDNDLTRTALETFKAVLETVPEVALSKDSANIWERLQDIAKDTARNSQLITAQLLEQYFSDVASTSSKLPDGLSTVPLQGSGGLELSAETMRQLCYASVNVLLTATKESDQELVGQTTQNLKFLGRCFSSNGMLWRSIPEDDSDDEDPIKDRDPSAVAYLLNRLSYITRQDQVYLNSRIAALESQISIINHITTIPDLAGTIRPAYLIADSNIPREAGHGQEQLTEKASELLELLQKKTGNEIYLAALSKVRNEAKARREERRNKRRIEAVSAPERWAKEKKRKHDARKATLKARGLEARGKRRGW